VDACAALDAALRAWADVIQAPVANTSFTALRDWARCTAGRARADFGQTSSAKRQLTP